MDATPIEEWLPVVGWEGMYEVSSAGRVTSLPRLSPDRWGGLRMYPAEPRLLKVQSGRYPQVLLCDGKRRSRKLVHQLVLEAFVGPAPEGMECCHLNDDGFDNRLSNLRWDTRTANHIDCVVNGRNSRSNQTHCKHGHEFTAENTFVSAGKGRRPRRKCRQCDRNRRTKDRRTV